MKQIVSLSRNFYINADNKDNLQPVCETIIAYTDGKEYSINNMMETTRSQKISEVRLDLTPHQIDELRDYLDEMKTDLLKFGAKVTGYEQKEKK